MVSNKLHGFFYFLLNNFGVLSSNFNELTQKFQVSKFHFIKNLLLIPAMVLIKRYLVPKSVYVGIARDSVQAVKGIRIFSRLMMRFMPLSVLITSLFCIYIQLMKQKKTLKFLNEFVQDFQKFPKHFARKASFASFCFISSLLADFFVTFKFSWQLFVVILSVKYRNLSVLAFCMFFSFLLKSFEQIMNKVNEKLRSSMVELTIFDDVSRLHKLLMQFNETFGIVVTMLTSYLATEIVFRVSN